MEDFTKTEYLTSGESIALNIIEVKSIPHLSVLGNSFYNEDELISRYKIEFKNLLNEIHNVYISLSNTLCQSKDISVELLWKSEEVKNQTFNGLIRFFIVIRAIDVNKDNSKNIVVNLNKIVKSTLVLQKYTFRDVEYFEFESQISNSLKFPATAIVKEEKVENLQNQLLPSCYSFDKFPISNNDLSRIVNVLIDYPNCMISLCLIPTVFNSIEENEIDRVSLALDTLSNGIAEQGIGNISFSIAEKHAKTYSYYSNNKMNALFFYNIVIYGNASELSNITSRVYGQLSSGISDSASLKLVSIDSNEINAKENLFPLPWALNEMLMEKSRNQQIWSSGQFSNAFYRLPYIITSEEAAEFFRLPLGSSRISAGLNINEADKTNKTYSSNIINAGEITVGQLRSAQNKDTIGFDLNDLAKHMLIVGTPGSGKTTFSVSLLDRLWKKHKIPFLVIEPAKNEYRALIKSIPDLQVFTPGKNFISPFVYNPFIPPTNVTLETYKSTLKTAFSAAVSMSSPLDKIFEETINNCYSDFRWLDTYTVADKGQVFNITDFIRCFQNTFDEIGYTGDAKNIGRAGVVRLNSLVNLFDNYFSIPIEDLLQKPTIIELAAIENSDQKALIISLLLLSILAYVNSNYIGEGGLKNVIMLEEAHVLLDADTNSGQGEANPSAIAQSLVKRMLAEIRSYGVGLIIADQSPRKVSTDVVALTDMKMVFRLVEASDKQIIADSTNMLETQASRMTKLKPGEAFLFFNKLDEPEEVITPNYRLENNISITLSDNGIKELSTYWNNKGQELRPYPQCEHCYCCQNSCDYSRRVLAKEVARRIFVKNFKPLTREFEVLKRVFAQISNLIRQELNDEVFSVELLSCVKVHLWRKIKYGTKIHVSDAQIENSLKKQGSDK